MARHTHNRSAFTITEMLTVIVLISMALALVMYVIRTGFRGVDANTNTFAAALQRARAEALGAQHAHGLSIRYTASGLVELTVVRSLAADGSPDTDQWETRTDIDAVSLSRGIGVKLILPGSEAFATTSAKIMAFDRSGQVSLAQPPKPKDELFALGAKIFTVSGEYPPPSPSEMRDMLTFAVNRYNGTLIRNKE